MRCLRWFCAVGLLLQLVLGVTACAGSHDADDERVWPEPAAGDAFFILGEDDALPQTQSAQQLSEYLASEHFEYDVGGLPISRRTIDLCRRMSKRGHPLRPAQLEEYFE